MFNLNKFMTQSETQNANEIILVDKPKGITSFGVIRRLRKEMGIKKMGHAGTLDPLATGLMIIGAGKGTKKLNEYIKLDKVYETQVVVGISTESGDWEGEIKKIKEVKKDISKKEINEALSCLKGEIELPVSIYSAIKKNGVPLYKRARRGEELEEPVRKMRIYDIKLKEAGRKEITVFSGEKFSCLILEIEVEVGSGTYVRSIAEEIGRKLGYPATIKELRRTQVGDFNVEDARKLEL